MREKHSPAQHWITSRSYIHLFKYITRTLLNDILCVKIDKEKLMRINSIQQANLKVGPFHKTEVTVIRQLSL